MPKQMWGIMYVRDYCKANMENKAPNYRGSDMFFNRLIFLLLLLLFILLCLAPCLLVYFWQIFLIPYRRSPCDSIDLWDNTETTLNPKDIPCLQPGFIQTLERLCLLQGLILLRASPACDVIGELSQLSLRLGRWDPFCPSATHYGLDFRIWVSGLKVYIVYKS